MKTKTYKTNSGIKRITILAMLGLFLLSGCVVSFGYQKNLNRRLTGGGTDTETSMVAGVVTKDGAPVKDAVVTIDGDEKLTAITNQDGEFEIRGVEYGSHTIQVTYELTVDEKYEFNQTLEVAGEINNLGTLPLKQIELPAKR